MKTIVTDGITYIEPLAGSQEWYWGSDYIHGDLYETEEVYHDHYPVKCNRLVFVHYPDDRIAEPVKGKAASSIFADGTRTRITGKKLLSVIILPGKL